VIFDFVLFENFYRDLPNFILKQDIPLTFSPVGV
jgi:hypothetical protein